MCNVHSKCASQWSGQCFYQSSKYILRPASELETRSNDLRFSSSLASFCFYIGLAITQDSQSLFEFKFIFVLQGLQCHMYFLFFFERPTYFSFITAVKKFTSWKKIDLQGTPPSWILNQVPWGMPTKRLAPYLSTLHFQSRKEYWFLLVH